MRGAAITGVLPMTKIRWSTITFVLQVMWGQGVCDHLHFTGGRDHRVCDNLRFTSDRLEESTISYVLHVLVIRGSAATCVLWMMGRPRALPSLFFTCDHGQGVYDHRVVRECATACVLLKVIMARGSAITCVSQVIWLMGSAATCVSQVIGGGQEIFDHMRFIGGQDEAVCDQLQFTTSDRNLGACDHLRFTLDPGQGGGDHLRFTSDQGQGVCDHLRFTGDRDHGGLRSPAILQVSGVMGGTTTHERFSHRCGHVAQAENTRTGI